MVEVNIDMQKVELTGPFEITCNKMEAQSNAITKGESPLRQFVHYCKHLESLNYFILSNACAQYKPVYVFIFSCL